MDASVTAGVIGISIALIELLKYTITKALAKKNGTNGVVKIHPEITRQIRETYEESKLLKKDIDIMKSHQERMSEAFSNIARSLEKVAESQEKTVETLDKINRRAEVEDAISRQLFSPDFSS